ncbi:MAG: sugar phosphate isomerase/epimerase, partial [Eubacteriales bacterium]|nr:sugar phosphate isomerase/epimerase [Eubacteriales bacterium]
MLISATGKLAADEGDSILYRGPYQTILPWIAEDGFQGVELHMLDSRETDREALWKLLSQNHLTLTSVGTGSAYGARGYNLVDRDPDIRRETIRHLQAHMVTLAPSHGVLIVGLIAGRNRDCGAPIEEQKRRLAEALRELDDLAGRSGVTVGLEMMNRYECDFLYTVDEGIRFLDGVGGLTHTKLHIDTVSMNISEADIGAVIRAGRGYIGHVHICDNDRCYPGHGHYNFRETLQALKDIGYNGALALEEKPFPDTRTAARRSLAYLNAVMDK